MKINWKSGLALFCGATAVGACAFYPSSSDAATWRQYSATGCAIVGQPMPAFESSPQTFRSGIYRGSAVNQTVAPLATNPWPNLDHAPFECPIVEDESVHVKGG